MEVTLSLAESSLCLLFVSSSPLCFRLHSLLLILFFSPLPLSLPPHLYDPAGALQQKVLLAQPEQFPRRLFLDSASLPSLTLHPLSRLLNP